MTITESPLKERVLELLREYRALDEAQIQERLAIPLAQVRSVLWFMVHTDRTITCDKTGRYVAQPPSDTFPKMKRVHE